MVRLFLVITCNTWERGFQLKGNITEHKILNIHIILLRSIWYGETTLMHISKNVIPKNMDVQERNYSHVWFDNLLRFVDI